MTSFLPNENPLGDEQQPVREQQVVHEHQSGHERHVGDEQQLRHDQQLNREQQLRHDHQQAGRDVEDTLQQVEEPSALVRSFLGRSLRSGPEVEFDERSFRPFLVTGGRTTSEFPLDFEAMVTPTPAGLCADLRFEQRTILDRCIHSGAQSIAELAAYLKLPIGTVRVVAADLVSSHLLDVHSPDKNLSNDVLMLKRLINGVRAL
jgi:Protein of unknown function (DUF742)